MKHIKFILLLLAIPFLLVRIKMEHFIIEREKKGRTDLREYTDQDLSVAMDTGKNKEINKKYNHESSSVKRVRLY